MIQSSARQIYFFRGASIGMAGIAKKLVILSLELKLP